MCPKHVWTLWTLASLPKYMLLSAWSPCHTKYLKSPAPSLQEGWTLKLFSVAKGRSS